MLLQQLMAKAMLTRKLSKQVHFKKVGLLGKDELWFPGNVLVGMEQGIGVRPLLLIPVGTKEHLELVSPAEHKGIRHKQHLFTHHLGRTASMCRMCYHAHVL